MKKLNKKGVSLAELLAVVVIMGIIAAIAIPLVGNVIETSKKKAYLGDLTTVVEAARVYCLTDQKDGDLFCKNIEDNAVGSAAENGNGVLNVNKGILYFATEGQAKDESDYTSTNISTITDLLDIYMSKTKAKIATGDLKIVQLNNKYYVNVAKNASDKFMFKVAKGYLDPTDPNALDDLIPYAA